VKKINKYIKIFKCTLRDQLVYLPAFMIGNIFFLVIIFVFFSLWRVIYGENALIGGLSITQMLWYLTFTETIELAKCRIYLTIQDEVKDGSIAYGLNRPYSYNGFKIARAMGESTVKFVPIMILGYLAACFFVGPLSGYWTALPFGVVLIMGGLLLNSLWMLIIGLLAFWTEEVTPFYWIFQKLIFIMGGMFFPIDFFPAWLQGTAKSLPFAYSAYWPAITMVNFSWETFRTGLMGQIFYICLLAIAAQFLFAGALKKVHVQGG
jgi:ABC-2 type transport system permease protein